MKKRFILAWVLILTVFAGLYVKRISIFTWSGEKLINLGTAEYLGGTVRLKRVVLDRRLKLRVEGIQGVLKTENDFFPFEMDSVESRGPVYRILAKDGSWFDFRNIRPRGSSRQGVDAHWQFHAGREWFSNFEMEVREIGLEDMRWLDPQNLKGASGLMTGRMVFSSNSRDEMRFQTGLAVAEPGGFLQERFFEILKPYMPQIREIRGSRAVSEVPVVGFKEARLELNMVESDRLKGFLYIRIPEYNLNLNLNLEIRIDEKNAFSKLLKVMGLIKVRG